MAVLCVGLAGALLICFYVDFCEMSFSTLSLFEGSNDKKTLEIRALSFDRDDELGEGQEGLEEVLKAKKPKDLRKGNPSTFYTLFSLTLSIYFSSPSLVTIH